MQLWHPQHQTGLFTHDMQDLQQKIYACGRGLLPKVLIRQSLLDNLSTCCSLPVLVLLMIGLVSSALIALVHPAKLCFQLVNGAMSFPVAKRP